jgi:hypothetical protein
MRCDSCNGLIKKTDEVCYTCGDKVPDYVREVSARQQISLLSNIVFLASLAFSLFSFLSDRPLPLTISLIVSAGFLLLRIFAERAHSPKSTARPLL